MWVNRIHEEVEQARRTGNKQALERLHRDTIDALECFKTNLAEIQSEDDYNPEEVEAVQRYIDMYTTLSRECQQALDNCRQHHDKIWIW